MEELYLKAPETQSDGELRGFSEEGQAFSPSGAVEACQRRCHFYDPLNTVRGTAMSGFRSGRWATKPRVFVKFVAASARFEDQFEVEQ